MFKAKAGKKWSGAAFFLATLTSVSGSAAWTPIDAVRAAAADLSALPTAVRPHQWYLWQRDPSPKAIAATTYALNTGLSTARIPLRPAVVADGRLLRIDLRDWRPAARASFSAIASGYADPFFYVPDGQPIQPAGFRLPHGAVAASWPPKVVKREGAEVLVRTLPYDHKGRTWNAARIQSSKLAAALEAADGVQFAPALLNGAPQACASLIAQTGLQTPIVDAQRWLVHSLSTADGGLYYRLQGIEGKTQAEWLASFGATINDARELVGVGKSGVTGKPRRVLFTIGSRVRQSTAYPLVAITQDPADGAFDVRRDPLYTLGDAFAFDAVEAMAMRSNGFISFALFDGAGKLQSEAPPNIVTDHRIPAGHTARLQGAISCIRCHGVNELWQPVANDVQQTLGVRLLAEPGTVRRLTPLAGDGRLAKLAERYGGDLSRPLQYARDSHHAAVFRVCGMGASEAAAAVAETFGAYVFEPVDAARAVAELGGEPGDDPRAELAELLPPDGVEDITVARLRIAQPSASNVVTRATWESVYQPTLSRMVANQTLPPLETAP